MFLPRRGVCPTSRVSTGAPLSSRKGLKHPIYHGWLCPEGGIWRTPINQNLHVSQLWRRTGESVKWLDKWLIMKELVSWGSPHTSPFQIHLQPWEMKAGPRITSQRPSQCFPMTDPVLLWDSARRLYNKPKGFGANSQLTLHSAPHNSALPTPPNTFSFISRQPVCLESDRSISK